MEGRHANIPDRDPSRAECCAGVVVQGELAATAVNAPMVPAEVLAELQPFVSLSQGLGTAAVQLVANSGFTDVKITYASPRFDPTGRLPACVNAHSHAIGTLHEYFSLAG